MNEDQLLKKYEDVALSDSALLKLIDGKAKIVLYPDLINYSNIDDVLGEYQCCVLLFEVQKNYGHWCCLFKVKPDEIEFFNPYGGYPDDSLDFIPLHFREVSNQYYPYLSLLLYNSPYQLSYNEHHFQKHGSGIRTCGRHCAVRILCRELSLDQYTDFLNYYREQLNMDYDALVTYITMNILK